MSSVGKFFNSFFGGSSSSNAGPKRMPGGGLSINNNEVTVGETYTGCYDVNGQKACYKNGQLQDSYTPNKADSGAESNSSLSEAARDAWSGN